MCVRYAIRTHTDSPAAWSGTRKGCLSAAQAACRRGPAQTPERFPAASGSGAASHALPSRLDRRVLRVQPARCRASPTLGAHRDVHHRAAAAADRHSRHRARVRLAAALRRAAERRRRNGGRADARPDGGRRAVAGTARAAVRQGLARPACLRCRPWAWCSSCSSSALELRAPRRHAGAASRRPATSASQRAVPMVLGLAIAPVLHPRWPRRAWRSGPSRCSSRSALSITAFPVMARILKDRGMTRTASASCRWARRPWSTCSPGCCSRWSWRSPARAKATPDC